MYSDGPSRPAKPWMPREAAPVVAATPPPRARDESRPADVLRRRWFWAVVLVLLGAILAAVVGPMIVRVGPAPKRLQAGDPRAFSQEEHLAPGHLETDGVSVIFRTPPRETAEGNEESDKPSSQEHDPNATGY